MAGVELAVGYISLAPSARGFQAALKKEIGGDIDAVGQEQGKRLGGGIASGTKKAMAALGGVAVAAGAFDFAKGSVEAFKESEQSSAKLADAFARFPALADSNVASFERLATARAKLTRFDDDATKAGQATLAQFGLTGQQVEQLTPLLQDYAAKTGKDLPSAAEDLGKAMLGQGRALKTIGLEFKDTGTASGNFEQLMGGLRTQVGGFAEKEGATAAGKTEILKNQFGELQETVGSKLIPVVLKLTDAALKVVSWVSNLSPGAQRLIGVIVGLVAVLFTIVKVTQAWTAVQAAYNIVMDANPVVFVVLAIVALVAIVVLAYTKVGWFRDLVDGAFRLIKSVIEGVVTWVRDNWPLLLAILTGPIGLAVLFITRNWDTIKAGFTAVKDWIFDKIGDIVGFLTGIPGRIAGVASTMWNGVKDAFTAVKDWIGDRIGDIIGFVTGIKDRIAKVAGGIFDPIKDGWKAIINGIIDLWNRIDFSIDIEVPSWVPKVGGKGFHVDDVFPDVPQFATGGMVPGPKGAPQLIVAHGGEEVLTAAQSAAGGGSGFSVGQMNVTTRREEETARDIVLGLRKASWLAAR